jgi:hypothetical protein
MYKSLILLANIYNANESIDYVENKISKCKYTSQIDSMIHTIFFKYDRLNTMVGSLRCRVSIVSALQVGLKIERKGTKTYFHHFRFSYPSGMGNPEN